MPQEIIVNSGGYVPSSSGGGSSSSSSPYVLTVNEIIATGLSAADIGAVPVVPTVDANTVRVATELENFTGWLSANSLKGYIGEVGIPNNTDSTLWNNVLSNWFTVADLNDLWVTGWSTGDAFGTTYNLSIYEANSGGSLNTAMNSATVFEAHKTTSNYRRGVNLSGPEFGAPIGSTNGTGTSYGNAFYPSAGDWVYLASRGVTIVRLPIKWERIQPQLQTGLSTSELNLIKTALAQAYASGISVILDVHNYCEYLTSSGTLTLSGISGASFGSTQFNDLWTRMSTAFKGTNGLLAYDLMNEPSNIAAATGSFTPTSTFYTFDSSTQGWTSSAGTTSLSTTVYHDGIGSLQVSIPAGQINPLIGDNDPNGEVNRTSTPTFSAWVMVPSGQATFTGTVSAKVLMQNATYSYDSSTYTTLTPGTWTQISYTPPSGDLATSRALAVQFQFANATTGTVLAYIDTVQGGNSSGNATGAQQWQTISQAAVAAIRANSDTTLIMVEGFGYAGAETWTSNHPTPWITDSANNFMYEAHHYFDGNHAGLYAASYASELASSEENYTAGPLPGIGAALRVDRLRGAPAGFSPSPARTARSPSEARPQR